MSVLHYLLSHNKRTQPPPPLPAPRQCLALTLKRIRQKKSLHISFQIMCPRIDEFRYINILTWH